MAREGLRSHLSGSVPVSIVVHLVLLLVLVVIPLMDIALPIPAGMMPSYVLAAPLPPPPPSVVSRSAPSPVPQHTATPAPVNPPEHLVSEPPSITDSFTPMGRIEDGPLVGVGVPGGVGPPSVPPQPPPDPPAPAGPVRVAELPQVPLKIVDVRPVYPEIARSARVDGTVVLEAILDTAGRVTQVRVVRSVPLLDQAAVDAVRQWRYSPSTYGGRAVSVLMTITVRFTLQR